AANCKLGGGLSLGGQGSNTPTINLEPPGAPPLTGVPAKLFFHQVFGTADPGSSTSFGTIFGSGVDGVVHVPATPITLSGGTNFGSCIELIASAFIFSGGATMD